MIKREFRVNFKSFIIWTSILIVMFLFVFAIYPYLMTEETIESMNELMQVFSEDMLKAFNMDMSSIATAYGWLKSEGFIYVLLVVGIYSSMLGGNIVLREESDKTIDYLLSLPITRKKVVTNKLIVSVIYIISMVVALGVFNFIGLLISGDFDKVQFIVLSITPIFVALPLFAINLFLSMFLHKTKAIIGISLGTSIGFYLIYMISGLSDKIDFIKYFTIYTLADIRNVLANTEISIWCIIISLLISGGFIFASYYIYDNKELM